MIRSRVFYSGNVQGVGFRFTAQRTASRFAVTGWVRNLADGRVELLAEGASSEVQAFLTRLSESMAHHIANSQVFEEPPTGEFSGFEIAR
jgi:acylphosphatase